MCLLYVEKKKNLVEYRLGMYNLMENITGAGKIYFILSIITENAVGGNYD